MTTASHTASHIVADAIKDVAAELNRAWELGGIPDGRSHIAILHEALLLVAEKIEQRSQQESSQ